MTHEDFNKKIFLYESNNRTIFLIKKSFPIGIKLN